MVNRNSDNGVEHAVLDLDGLDALIGVLRDEGHLVIGPVRRDNAITLAEVTSVVDLPAGWGVDVGPGHYRVRRRSDEAVFGHSAGPQSWKSFLHPSHRTLASSDSGGFHVPDQPSPKYAFLGARACDIAAIAKLTQVLRSTGRTPFVVAAQCTEPGEVCFCASMRAGPAVESGYDVALTERIDDEGHRFLATAATPAGVALLARLPRRAAQERDVALAESDVAAAADRMGRAMPEVDLRALLAASRDSAHWESVAERCLTCGNCTMVCPTCFCVSTEDVTDLSGEHAERAQRWASCFEIDFTGLHGGAVRTSGASRYRQWMSHKLGTWHDQFGTSGCVGCGRCIAWCPVGIDITEEAAALTDLLGGQP
jgi:ferredoxin